NSADRLQVFVVWRTAAAVLVVEATDAVMGSLFACEGRSAEEATGRGAARVFRRILLFPESGISVAVLLRAFGRGLGGDLRVPGALLDVGKLEGRKEGGRERFQPNAFAGDSGNHVAR